MMDVSDGINYAGGIFTRVQSYIILPYFSQTSSKWMTHTPVFLSH